MDQPTPVFTREGSFPLAVPDGPIAGAPTPNWHSNPGLDISSEPSQSIKFGRKGEQILAAMPRED